VRVGTATPRSSASCAAAGILRGPERKFSGDKKQFTAALRQAYQLAALTCYAQGFEQLRVASAEYKYNLKPADIARIWKGGCIVRARMLDPIAAAFVARPDLKNLMVDPYFSKLINETSNSLREVVKIATDLGTPGLALSTALGYIDSYRQRRLPANLLQALRDYFGAHTYRRVDKEGVFHTEWSE
jgi:6-phosphogluconate dehydrogenase